MTLSRRIMTLSWSILLGNQKRNVQKPYKEIRQAKAKPLQTLDAEMTFETCGLFRMV